MGYQPIEESRMYGRAEKIADAVWELTASWEWFARRSVGVQLVDAADSIGANIAEGLGRFHPGEARQFLYYARGSLRETKFRLRRCRARGLIQPAQFGDLDEELEQLSREINQEVAHQRQRKAKDK